MRVYPLWIPTASAVTSFTSAPLVIQDNGNVAIGVTITGADVAGTLSLQAAFDDAFARPFLIQAATAITASADTLYNLNDINYPFLRLLWVYSSGTGNISVDAAVRQQILNRG